MGEITIKNEFNRGILAAQDQSVCCILDRDASEEGEEEIWQKYLMWSN